MIPPRDRYFEKYHIDVCDINEFRFEIHAVDGEIEVGFSFPTYTLKFITNKLNPLYSTGFKTREAAKDEAEKILNFINVN